MSCPVLDPSNNGMIDCTSNEVGSTCTFKCNTGFELTGSVSQTCQDNGTWSGTETACTPGLLQVVYTSMDMKFEYKVNQIVKKSIL